MKKYIRHGDVLVEKVESLVYKDMSPQKDSVLLEGEVTGHAHRLPTGTEVWRKEPSPEEDYLVGTFNIETETPLSHEEHHTIKLSPGVYKHYGQREHDPVEEHMVID